MKIKKMCKVMHTQTILGLVKNDKDTYQKYFIIPAVCFSVKEYVFISVHSVWFIGDGLTQLERQIRDKLREVGDTFSVSVN